ncbi:hypothetical protein MLD38_040018 [Melastoma candidum]|uniref:Uncharacterized protein n=1 Tax=Melastoma candidum TaxID=119954 RepID=A0ACB9L561_9MYRT|nr:hypothetical protein MLD38_040018 [Melastoma candidum]
MENTHHYALAAAAGFVWNEGASELIRQLASQLGIVGRRCAFFKDGATEFRENILALLPLIEAIKYSGAELPEKRQVELDRLSRLLRDGVELTHKLLASKGWHHIYEKLRLQRQMDNIEREICRFIRFLPVYIMADVQQMRAEMAERFDSYERSKQRTEQSLWDVRFGTGAYVAEAVRIQQEAEAEWGGGEGVIVALENGKRIVREMLIGRDDQHIVGIHGIGGSGKTTLAREVIRDAQVKAHFSDRILFLTVSQSPNMDVLKARIKSFFMGLNGYASYEQLAQWTLHHNLPDEQPRLIVLDDVWTDQALRQLEFRIPGCKTLVVSRFNFYTIYSLKYEMEILSEGDAMAVFCQSAFGQRAIRPGFNETLVKQVVSECEGLPLALKVIGASLRDQEEIYWKSAKARLSKGEPISDTHRSLLSERMAISVDYLQPNVRECFLDLGAFPEDMKIPLDILVRIWVETRGIDEEEAYAIVADLSNKNLLTLVQDARAGDSYSSCFEISITQHDVLRDLAIQLSNQGEINARKRLVMPRRERKLPGDWDRNSERPFQAQIVSVHTEQMEEMDWQQMDFPKAEVLIINFSAEDYFLPPFIDNMPNLRALIVINHGTTNAVLRNFSVFSNLANLQSLWLEKICVPQLTDMTIPLCNMKKICIVLCKINNSLDPSRVDIPQIFPGLVDLTIDHCDDLFQLPSGICGLSRVRNLSITNCHSLQKLPADLDRLSNLEILRVYACPNLKSLPQSVCELSSLKYLDISQCVNLTQLPEGISRMTSLEKIDMRECPQVMHLPMSFRSMKSLRNVICDEEVTWGWKEVAKDVPNLNIKIAEKCFTLDWLDE